VIGALYRRIGVVEMSQKETEIQQTSLNTEPDISLQDILNGVEDELIVIDRDYRIKFANSAAQRRFHKKAKSLVGKICYQVFYNQKKPCSPPLWDCPLA